MSALFGLVVTVCFTLGASRVSAQASYCDQIVPAVPPCLEPLPRDLLFLVDASQSMNRDKFYTDMLDYTLALYCAFDQTLANQAGMLVFAREIKVVVPLAQYTRTQWLAQVNTVKEDPTACCSCCTPTADAFDVASAEFAARRKNAIAIAFAISDGVPSNNNYLENGVEGVQGLNGNATWWFYNAQRGFNPATYNFQIVPQRALALKNQDVRLMLVGVPDRDGNPPDQRYFNGGYNQNALLCLTRAQTEFCARYNRPPFPIVSSPTLSNSFSTTNWDVQRLINTTVSALCIVPTTAPSQIPSRNPTPRPTSLTPTRIPTRKPTSRAPSRNPTKAPTSKPTRSPTRRPTNAPTRSPTFVFMNQLDVTFLIDRSKSMRWHDDSCKAIVDSDTESNPFFNNTASNAKFACWELFMRYILRQVDLLALMPSGPTKNKPMGWAKDFQQHIVDSPRQGLRVNIMGFSCTNEQKTPKVYHWSRQRFGGPVSTRSDLVALLNELRASVVPEGGTCPGLAIEEAVKYVEVTNDLEYPLHSAILLTDGMFYDMPAPTMAVEGLKAYKVLRFAIGIAVAKDKRSYGLSTVERLVQRQQLAKFVAPSSRLFKDLGQNGWSLLPFVAEDIVQDMASYFFLGKSAMRRYTWCGFRRAFNCASDVWRKQHCYWPDDKTTEYGCQKRPWKKD